jgi:hypothetical protein
MPLSTQKIYYCSTSSFPGTTFGALSDGVNPPVTYTTRGWNTGRINPPLYCEMNWNQEVVRTSTQWQATPTQSAPNQNVGGSGAGNCWALGPVNGEFLAGNWQITMSMKSVTAAAAHTGRFIYRFWTSLTGSGENASLITSSYISSSVLSMPGNTTTVVAGTSSINLPYMNLRNEYIFIQTYWSVITNPGGGPANNNVDQDYVLGNITSSLVRPTSFISHNRSGFVACENSQL